MRAGVAVSSVAAILVVGALVYGQPGASEPHLALVDAPPYDCGGPEKTAPLIGRVEADRPEQYVVVIYSRACNGIAYIQPTVAAPKTRVSTGGDFRAEIHLGTTYYALLLRADAKREFKPQVTVVPEKGNDILAVAVVVGRQAR